MGWGRKTEGVGTGRHEDIGTGEGRESLQHQVYDKEMQSRDGSYITPAVTVSCLSIAPLPLPFHHTARGVRRFPHRLCVAHLSADEP